MWWVQRKGGIWLGVWLVFYIALKMLTHSSVYDEDATAAMTSMQWFLVDLWASWAVGAAATVLSSGLHCWCRPCAYFECPPPQPSTPNFLSWFIVSWTIDGELIDSVHSIGECALKSGLPRGVLLDCSPSSVFTQTWRKSLFQGAGGIPILSFVLTGANVTLGNWALLTWY